MQGLTIQDADPAADAEALERLALWMLQRFAPIVAADPPDGIIIDSTGADHLHGGEAALLATLVDKLAGVGLCARAAIADTWGAAHALARFRAQPDYISERGNAGADVSRLPIIALRLAPDLVHGLRVLGFDRVGDLLAQPRAPLALRFGPELGRRLDQATGPDRRADRAYPPRSTDRGSPCLRRTDRRGGDHRALYRQARGPALRRLGAEGPRRTAARSHLPSRRQSRPGRARRDRPARCAMRNA